MDFLRELSRLPVSSLLSLTVLAAVITASATLGSTVLKEYLFARSFERWKHAAQLQAVYRRYRDPLVLAALELLNRMREIVYQSPVTYLDASLLAQRLSRFEKNDAADPYYRRYKLMSTVFRLCSWFALLELYRREITFLDSGHNQRNRDLETHLAAIRSDIADGHLNDADDWLTWTDGLIFREEQRAIGECMITQDKHVLGYAGFVSIVENPEGEYRKRWIEVATNFLLAIGTRPQGRDFGRVRALRLICHLIGLIRMLDPSRLPGDWHELRTTTLDELAHYRMAEPVLGCE